MDESTLVAGFALRDILCLDLVHIALIGKGTEFVGILHHNRMRDLLQGFRSKTTVGSTVHGLGIAEATRT